MLLEQRWRGSFTAWLHHALKEPLPDPAVPSCEQSSPFTPLQLQTSCCKPNVLWRRNGWLFKLAGDFGCCGDPDPADAVTTFL